MDRNSKWLRWRGLTLVGISGSPIVNGNTDRMVKAVLGKSGKDYVFVNLSTLRYDPCRACVHRCAKTNMCPLDDDLKRYLVPILNSEALVLGTSVNASNVSAWMFSFLSRLWCFRHVERPLRDKPVLLIASGLFKRSKYRVLANFIEARLPSENILGYIYYTTEIPPCFTCGRGNVCKIGALWELLDRDEERLKNWKLTEDMFKRWEDNPETVADVDQYARILANL